MTERMERYEVGAERATRMGMVICVSLYPLKNAMYGTFLSQT